MASKQSLTVPVEDAFYWKPHNPFSVAFFKYNKAHLWSVAWVQTGVCSSDLSWNFLIIVTFKTAKKEEGQNLPLALILAFHQSSLSFCDQLLPTTSDCFKLASVTGMMMVLCFLTVMCAMMVVSNVVGEFSKSFVVDWLPLIYYIYFVNNQNELTCKCKYWQNFLNIFKTLNNV